MSVCLLKVALSVSVCLLKVALSVSVCLLKVTLSFVCVSLSLLKVSLPACLSVFLSMSEMSPSHVSVKICSLSAQRLSKSASFQVTLVLNSLSCLHSVFPSHIGAEIYVPCLHSVFPSHVGAVAAGWGIPVAAGSRSDVRLFPHFPS